ncbi:MAG: hypothetical protein IPL04_16875 [Chitinophagaceae bacterium]|nr:hypothetical protein [Chitinophagaceae bacterium]
MSIATSFNSRYILPAVVMSIVVLISSCGVIPKDYPVKKPFVFKYNVTVDGNYTTAEKNDLESRLSRQLDDSIRVRTSHKLLYKGQINALVLNKPPEFKTAMLTNLFCLCKHCLSLWVISETVLLTPQQ